MVEIGLVAGVEVGEPAMAGMILAMEVVENAGEWILPIEMNDPMASFGNDEICSRVH